MHHFKYMHFKKLKGALLFSLPFKSILCWAKQIIDGNFVNCAIFCMHSYFLLKTHEANSQEAISLS